MAVVQLSQMTRKKKSFPCYGMQWSAPLYLYPLEESLEEIFFTPPRPEVINEARMYGGRWDEPSTGVWRLTWSEAAIESAERAVAAGAAALGLDQPFLLIEANCAQCAVTQAGHVAGSEQLPAGRWFDC